MTAPEPTQGVIGPATRLALVNFQVSGRPIPLSIVRALVVIKRSMARANAQRAAELTGVDAAIADAISRAADEVLRGDWDDQFAIDTFQTGSGTSTNMNVNEVLAALASRHLDGMTVHPNDHVNASQSTNDVFPTAVRIAVLSEVRDVLDAGPRRVARRTRLIVPTSSPTSSRRAGPTSWMRRPSPWDRSSAGTPRRSPKHANALGHDGAGRGGPARGYRHRERPERSRRGRRARDRRTSRDRPALRCTRRRTALRPQASPDGLVELSGQLRVTATGHVQDRQRHSAAGERAPRGFRRDPDPRAAARLVDHARQGQPGAVRGRHAGRGTGRRARCGSRLRRKSGHARDEHLSTGHRRQPALAAISLLGRAAGDFGSRCVLGIEADRDRCRAYAHASPAIAAALNPLVGYDVATQLVRRAEAEHRPLRDVVLDSGVLDPAPVDAALDVDRLARGPGWFPLD